MPEAAVTADRSATAEGTGWVATLPRVTRSTAEPSIHIDGDRAPEVATVHNLSVMFDGALYNGPEIARELGLPAGASPASLVAHAWQVWGPAALDRLKGIFLLAVADRARESIAIARDPLGVYPGFYVLGSDALHVSTSVAPLLGVRGVSRSVNRLALADHLCHRWPDPEETYFEQVRRLPPANVVMVTAAGLSRRQYWDPDPIDQPTRWATEEELDQFESVLDRAVSRAMAFGPTGIFLSGGFDSISVAAFATDIARRGGQRDPMALSLAFPDPSCNEEDRAARRGEGTGDRADPPVVCGCARRTRPHRSGDGPHRRMAGPDAEPVEPGIRGAGGPRAGTRVPRDSDRQWRRRVAGGQPVPRRRPDQVARRRRVHTIRRDPETVVQRVPAVAVAWIDLDLRPSAAHELGTRVGGTCLVAAQSRATADRLDAGLDRAGSSAASADGRAGWPQPGRSQPADRLLSPRCEDGARSPADGDRARRALRIQPTPWRSAVASLLGCRSRGSAREDSAAAPESRRARQGDGAAHACTPFPRIGVRAAQESRGHQLLPSHPPRGGAAVCGARWEAPASSRDWKSSTREC